MSGRRCDPGWPAYRRGQGASGRHGACHSASRIGGEVADRVVVTLAMSVPKNESHANSTSSHAAPTAMVSPAATRMSASQRVPAGPRPGDDTAAKRSAQEQWSGSGWKDEMRDGAVEGGAPDAAKRDDVARDRQQRDEEGPCHCGCASRVRETSPWSPSAR